MFPLLLVAALTAFDTDYSGLFFDPATDGQGFVTQALAPDRLILTFYGFGNDRRQLWLIGDFQGSLADGAPVTAQMLFVDGGNFGFFPPRDVNRTPWGTGVLRFDSANRGELTLDGSTGRQTLSFERLADSSLAETRLQEFGSPERITIRDYFGQPQDPALSPDGRYLLFNNANRIPENTDLFYAERVDDVTFDFRGPIQGANVDGVPDVRPSLDRTGNLYFVSGRDFDSTRGTLFVARFADGAATDVRPVEGIGALSDDDPAVSFDVAVTPDGETLYFAEGRFDGGRLPDTGNLVIAARQIGASFRRLQTGSALLQNLIDPALPGLAYGAAVSDDGLELFYTSFNDGSFRILRSTRRRVDAAWGVPEPLAQVTDNRVEAPSLSADGK
ncbi:MAG: hypothetical protein AAGE01_21955, partial [Pseudomonadota bacterium]